jgi:hypothetical protein
MTLDERHNEVLRAHSEFLRALAVASAGGAGFAAIGEGNWNAALVFMALSMSLHWGAVELLERLRLGS